MKTPDTPRKAKCSTWRLCFRWTRICILLCILTILAAFLYLGTVGAPDFVKRRLVQAVRERGVDIEFTRLRWDLYRGLIADNVSFGPAQSNPYTPQFEIRQVILQLNNSALFHRKLQIDSLALTRGEMTWRLEESNQPPETLSVSNIQTQLRFLTNDQWVLDNFTAGFAGAKLQLSGSLTNASSIKKWLAARGSGGQSRLLRLQLYEFARAVDQISFALPPELDVIIRGDAADVNSFNGQILLDARGANTPWGALTNASLRVQVAPADGTNSTPHAECKLQAEEFQTPWGSANGFKLDVEGIRDEHATDVVQAKISVSAERFSTEWAEATNALFTAHWTHSLTNPIPLAGTGELSLNNAATKWGTADQVTLSGGLMAANTNATRHADATWGFWAGLEPYPLELTCHVKNVHVQDFQSADVAISGIWRAPDLTITNLHTEMYQGEFDAGASLNVATRLAEFKCVSDFDALKALPLLPTNASAWFEKQQFTWEKPPVAHATGSVTLPAWTNRPPDWREQVAPTFQMQGDFKVCAATYHAIPVTSAQSHFSYSNFTWNLPDLVAIRPEGRLEMTHVSSDKTADYYFRFHSTVDVKNLRVLLNERGQRALDEFTFSQPPVFDAEIWGRWHQLDRIGARAHLTVTNVTYRGELATFATGDFFYTNKFLLITNGRTERTNLFITADALGLDFEAKKGYLTNAFSTMPALAVPHCIGPKVTHDVEPYIFNLPPTVRASGVIPLSDDISVANLRFNIVGDQFQWLHFRCPHIAGVVTWQGKDLSLTDVKADFYEGKLSGHSAFDFRRKDGANFNFDILATDVNLHLLMADIKGSNHLEGKLSGHLNVNQANTEETNSWFGTGHLSLRDGLVWEFPVFGILSPVLESFSPGLGTAHISDATASFLITNSVIRTSDLALRATTFRLLYDGTVDFGMRVDARVEADVGHDVPLVGPLVSMVFTPFGKLFETHVTGTLADPKSSPIGFGRLINPIFHPWSTLRDLMPGNSSAPSTNSPPPVQPANLH